MRCRSVAADPARPGGCAHAHYELTERFAPAGHAFNNEWHYRDADGRLLGLVVRYDRPANGLPADKQVKPITYCEGPRGQREWRCKGFPEPRPLYRLDHLKGQPDAPVLVVEGEKTAEAATKRFPDYVVTTSPGGCKAAHKADWAPLAGRHVVIWPDGDAPGIRYADNVAEMLLKIGASSVRTVALPPGLPNGWDLADALPSGWDEAELLRLLAEARTPRTNPPLPLFRLFYLQNFTPQMPWDRYYRRLPRL